MTHFYRHSYRSRTPNPTPPPPTVLPDMSKARYEAEEAARVVETFPYAPLSEEGARLMLEIIADIAAHEK